jgi:hypothetical protein
MKRLLQEFDGFKEQGSLFEGLQSATTRCFRALSSVPKPIHRFQAFKARGALDWRFLDIFLAGDWRGNLQRDGAHSRYQTGPCALRSWRLVPLCDWLLCLALRVDDDAARQRNDRFTAFAAICWAARAGLEFRYRRTRPRDSNIYRPPCSGVTFPIATQRSDSNFLFQELRAGLIYEFDVTSSDEGPVAALWPDAGRVDILGQMTFAEQAYPMFRASYMGTNSLPGTTWATRLGTRPSRSACGCGGAPNCGSTRRSIRGWI